MLIWLGQGSCNRFGIMIWAQKATRIARAKAHINDNRLQPGTSFGGSVACDAVDILGAERATQTGSEHFCAIVAAHDGTVEWLEQLRDMVVNSWPDQQRFQWHLAFAEALPVERDLTPCYHRICLELLQIPISNSNTWPANARAATVDLIERISTLHRRQERDETAWHAAKVLGEAAWLIAETAVKQAFKAAEQSETRMTTGECAAESALRAVKSATWSAWSPVHEAASRASWGKSGAEAGDCSNWAASRCAYEAVWSAGLGAAAQAQESLTWPLELPAWSRVADVILCELSR
jgi:hypothetical protein